LAIDVFGLVALKAWKRALDAGTILALLP